MSNSDVGDEARAAQEVARLTAELEEARATKDMHKERQQEEIERSDALRAERDALAAALVECREALSALLIGPSLSRDPRGVLDRAKRAAIQSDPTCAAALERERLREAVIEAARALCNEFAPEPTDKDEAKRLRTALDALDAATGAEEKEQ